MVRGSCIPLALARLFPGKKDAIRSEVDKEKQRNSEASKLGSRSYKALLESVQLHAVPCLGISVDGPVPSTAASLGALVTLTKTRFQEN